MTANEKTPRLYVYKGGNFTIIHTAPECPKYLGEAVAQMEDWDGTKHDPDSVRTAFNAERLVHAWNTHDSLVAALRTSRAEFATLSARLPEPYRSNAKKCCELIDAALK